AGFGVDVAERVEVLGVARADALGGLVYSFAGSMHNHDLVALDEVMVDDLASGDIALSTEILSSLFHSTNWYSVPSAPMDVGEYFPSNYRTDLNRSWREGTRRLGELDGSGAGGKLAVRRLEAPRDRVGMTIQSPEGMTVGVPDASVLGWGPLLWNAKSCLVHGDMHGGNVLLETSTDGRAPAGTARRHHRTCLIDFKNSGPGPRCIDAVCLEASIRLAQAELLTRSVESRNGSPRGDHPAPADEVLTLVEDEKRLYRWVFCQEGELPDSNWAKFGATGLQGLMACC